MNEPKKTPDPDINVEELQEPVAAVVFTKDELDALILLVNSTTVADLVRISFPDALTKPLHTTLRGLKLARREFRTSL